MIARFSFGRPKPKPPQERDIPTLRRADSHPDAPARRPIRASEDFGQPLPMVTDKRVAKAEVCDLPADLDTPLAAIDPAAIPAVPREPVRAVPSLASRPQMIDPGERFETFELTPIHRGPRGEVAVMPVRPTANTVEATPSIGTLLDRLEKKAGRGIRPGASIEETLGMLRKLATQ